MDGSVEDLSQQFFSRTYIEQRSRNCNHSRLGPAIAGQLLVCPVTDSTVERPSHSENATGFFLTRSLMYRFWDLHCAPADRSDPRASSLRGRLEGLPPAFVVTAELDPLRDEGIAYAEALAAAGVPVEQLQARGHIHSSFTMVDVIATAVGGREKMAQALQRFADLEEPGALLKAAE
jgi:acetyl esterase/lipase